MVESMTRIGLVPDELRYGPFTGSVAISSRMITKPQLRCGSWRQMFRDVYCHRDFPDTPELRAKAAALLLPAGAAISGGSAAYLLGLDVTTTGGPLEVTVPRDSAITCRPGLVVRRALLPAGDVTEVAGVPVTSPLRTAFDLGRRPGFVNAVVALDAFTHSGQVDLSTLLPYTKEHRGWRGIRWLADRAMFVEPAAESPMETRLRLVIVRASLPRPVAQYVVHDESGVFCGRLDLGYPMIRLGIEYDGAWHAAQPAFVADRQRLNRLRHAGWTLLHYTADDVYRRPSLIVSQVGAALRHAA